MFRVHYSRDDEETVLGIIGYDGDSTSWIGPKDNSGGGRKITCKEYRGAHAAIDNLLAAEIPCWGYFKVDGAGTVFAIATRSQIAHADAIDGQPIAVIGPDGKPGLGFKEAMDYHRTVKAARELIKKREKRAQEPTDDEALEAIADGSAPETSR